MKYLLNLLCFLPLLIVIFELTYLLFFNQPQVISPYSKNNNYLTELTNVLNISGLKYQQVNIFDYRQEVELVVMNQKNRGFKAVISQQKTPLSQVAALQKLIKIATIEGKEITFVDLSSRRPYATF